MASEIRVNKIENRSGLGTVTFADTGVDLAGIVTATTFSGSGASLTNVPDSALSAVTSSKLTGALPALDGSALTGVASTENIRTNTNATFLQNVNVSGSTTTGTAVVGGGVTISESGIEASGIGITCANINGGQIGGRRNLVINGAMEVAQRGDATGVTGGYGGCDRFRFDRDGASAVSLTQATGTASDGFPKAQRINITTADTDMGGTNFNILSTRFEGQNLQMIRKGTSEAQELTLSFYIKSTVTGTYIAELYDVDNSRQCSKAYTISSSNTWEKKEITFPADTTGTFGFDANRSMEINWWFGAGPTYAGGTLNTSWASVNNANRAAGQVNAVNSTSNDIYLTGVQLEIGSQATAFEYRNFAEELALCQRYFHAIINQGWSSAGYNGSYLALGVYLGSSKMAGYWYHPVPMRSNPTLIQGTATDGWNIYRADGGDVFNNLGGIITNSAAHMHGKEFTLTEIGSNVGSTGGYAGIISVSSDNAWVQFSSEL